MPGKATSHLCIIVLVAIVTIFCNLGGIPLLDPDEPVYAQTPKEMLAAGDFISPRIYGDYWYDKPPMYYWLVALSFKLFGMNEFAARFPSALLAVACIVMIYLAGRRLLGERAAMLGSLVLTTSIEYLYLSKAAVTDITLTLFLTGALLAFISQRYYWFYACAALATVTKGPVGLLFPAGIVFFYLLMTKDFRRLSQMKLSTGIVLYAVLALPWYFAMYHVHGQAFVETFLGFHNITRFTSPEHPRFAVWYYFIPVLILGFFPWTAVMAQAVWNSLRQTTQVHYPVLLFLNIWVFFIFLFFTFSSTKLVSYILPLYPPLALIVGWHIDRLWQSLHGQGLRSWAFLTVGLALLLAGGSLYAMDMVPGLQNAVAMLASIFVAIAGAAGYLLFKQRVRGAMVVLTSAMVLFSLVISYRVFPTAAPGYTSAYIAQAFAAHYDGASPVFVAKFLRPGFSFYSDVYGTSVVGADLAAVLQDGKRAYFVISQTEYKVLTAAERSQLRVLARSGDKLLLLQE